MSKTYIHKSDDKWAGEYEIVNERSCRRCDMASIDAGGEIKCHVKLTCPIDGFENVLKRISPSKNTAKSVTTDSTTGSISTPNVQSSAVRGSEKSFTILPTDGKLRKTYPMYSGCFAYFPDALALVSRVSWEGNEQHHPGTPLHWDKTKSQDESDAMLRHLVEGELDKVAWRALALLQRAIEAGWRPTKEQQNEQKP